mgnify:CR=1 FL=1
MQSKKTSVWSVYGLRAAAIMMIWIVLYGWASLAT